MIPNPQDQAESPVEQMARRFLWFAGEGTRGRSPLYAALSTQIAGDRELLELAAQARAHPPPNMLFAAAHYLLLKGIEHPLAAFYPSVNGANPVGGNPYPHFRAFCRAHRAAIIELLGTRLVQTNEVNRCGLLLPAFGVVARRAGGCPLALIEIGASAGLNLCWERYGYRYSDGRTAGNPQAALQLTTEVRGDIAPPLPTTLPAVNFRLGIDLNPVSVMDDDAVLWLRALVWPDQSERHARLLRAIEIARAQPPELIQGDVFEVLPRAIQRVPEKAALCILHSFVINQFSDAGRERFSKLLAELARARPIYRVSIEWIHGEHPRLELRTCTAGAQRDDLLAYCEPHGRWIAWAASAER